jgi:hypothetical protein
MSIRLNKVLTELNIGLQTAVDFLKNKKSLGEIKDDANVNTKISDEQYHALVSAFKGDKDIKSEAEKMFAKKSKDKKSDKKSSHRFTLFYGHYLSKFYDYRGVDTLEGVFPGNSSTVVAYSGSYGY